MHYRNVERNKPKVKFVSETYNEYIFHAIKIDRGKSAATAMTLSNLCVPSINVETKQDDTDCEINLILLCNQ
jgi:hypothetical protein